MGDLQTVNYAAILADRGDAYDAHFRAFLAWAGGRDVMDYASVAEYFRALEGAGYKANTVRIKRQAVKHRIRLVARTRSPEERQHMEQRLKDLDADVPPPKVASSAIGADKVVSVSEYRAMLAKATARQRCFIEALYVTGLRVSELCGALLENCVDQGPRVAVTVLGKFKKERTVYLPLELYGRIRETFGGVRHLLETRNGREYHRNYVSDQVRRLGRRVLGRRISAHSLRHSFATRKVRAFPGKLDAVSRYLGHSSVSITLSLYCHTELSNDEIFGMEEV